jgi:hypothetical protein
LSELKTQRPESVRDAVLKPFAADYEMISVRCGPHFFHAS